MNIKYQGYFKALFICFFSLAFFSEIAGISIPFRQDNLGKEQNSKLHFQEISSKFKVLEFVEIVEIEEDSDEDHYEQLKYIKSFVSINFLFSAVVVPSVLTLDDKTNRFLSLNISKNKPSIPLYTLFCSWKSFLS